MLRSSQFFFLVTFFWLLIFGCQEEKEQQNMLKEIYKEVQENFRGYDDLKESIDQNGHRLTGTVHGEKAEAFIYNKLKQYGLEVNYHSFEVESWKRESVQLTIHEDLQIDTFETVALAHTPVEVEVNAKIIDVGNGLRSDFEDHSDDVSGNIVLVNLHLENVDDEKTQNLHRSEKTALATEFGAGGIIFINKWEGGVLLTGTASVTGKLIDIPAICISIEDGEKLRERLSEGSELFAGITMSNYSGLVKARNVIGKITGGELPDEEIIIGGHLDSWDLSDGAIDNGIGIYAILDIARAFNNLKLQPKRTVKFAFWMGEEQGLLGSNAFLEDAIESGNADRIKYYINVDMTGNPSGFNIQGREEMAQTFASIGKAIHEIDTTFANDQKSEPSLHSDNQTFALEGFPTLHIIGNLDDIVYKYYHSNKDNFDLVNKEHMRNTSRILAMTLYELADQDAIEAKRLTSEEIKEFYTKAGLKEKLVLGNEWRWD